MSDWLTGTSLDHKKTHAHLPALGMEYKATTDSPAPFSTWDFAEPTSCAAMTSATTGRILEEILEYLPVLTVPSRERLLLKDTAWIVYCKMSPYLGPMSSTMFV